MGGITNCYNSAPISYKNNQYSQSDYIGGIAGTIGSVRTIENCYNIGDIIIESNKYGKSLLIDSIVLKEKYQNQKAKEIIINSIIKFKKNKKYNNIIIIASTEFEKEIANNLNFIKIKEFNDNSIIYSLKSN
jgi:hypothetical protein